MKGTIVHKRGDWGMTACNRDGWYPHVWSGWDHPDSLKSTMRWSRVTCKACRKKMKGKRGKTKKRKVSLHR